MSSVVLPESATPKKKGGARAGAGRKATATTIAARNRANQYARDGGALPVDVMILTMRKLWMEATTVQAKKRGKRKAKPMTDWDLPMMKEAHDIATDLAPYIHPKLASVEQSGPNGGPLDVMVTQVRKGLQGLSDAEFQALDGLMTKLGFGIATGGGQS